MKRITLPSGEFVPALGLGTWRMGEDAAAWAAETATIRLALEFGLTLIDTAEMYGEGRAEQLVGEAIQGHRDSVFLISKVYPHNASRKGAIAACERSLRRLATDRIDLYLLHWRGEVPLAETLAAFVALQQAGKIRHYGVSNLDRRDLTDLWSLPGGPAIATNQVLYNLMRRGIEWDLLPFLRERHVPIMAYSPFEQGRLFQNTTFVRLAEVWGMTPAQLALAWLLAREGVIAIPKTSRPERVRENLAALEHSLAPEQFAELELVFPPPAGPSPLAML
ncbi:MAG: aldo/keto reductase [Verrucomicrobiia bacterium]